MNNKLKDIFSKFRNFKKPAEKFVYVALGDSTTEGIGSTHSEKSFPALIYEAVKQDSKNAVFYNLGKKGAKVWDVVDLQLNEAVKLEPDLVTVSVGANDLRARTKLLNFEKDFVYLVNSLSEKTNAKIIVNSIPDLSQVPAIPFLIRIYATYMAKKFNRVMREQAEKSNIVFVDVHSGGKIFAKKYPELISADGLHPSDIGYAFWAAAILSQAKGVFFKKTN